MLARRRKIKNSFFHVRKKGGFFSPAFSLHDVCGARNCCLRARVVLVVWVALVFQALVFQTDTVVCSGRAAAGVGDFARRLDYVGGRQRLQYFLGDPPTLVPKQIKIKIGFCIPTAPQPVSPEKDLSCRSRNRFRKWPAPAFGRQCVFAHARLTACTVGGCLHGQVDEELYGGNGGFSLRDVALSRACAVAAAGDPTSSGREQVRGEAEQLRCVRVFLSAGAAV